jgi:hypothetical protein
VVGYEKLRRRPDLTGYNDGRPWLENYDAAYLDWIEAIGPPKHGEKRPVPGTPEEMEKAGYAGFARFAPYTGGQTNWCSVWYPCTLDEVLNVGVNELIGSAKMFGLAGVRFDGDLFASRYRTLDGSFVGDEDFDYEAGNVRLVRRMKDTTLAACPGYLFGYNASTMITWSVGDDNVPASFREKCALGGLIANEALAFPGDVPWLQYAQTVRREAEIVRHYGGHHATYAFNRNGDRPYNFIVNFALRSHVMNSYQGPGFDNADLHRRADSVLGHAPRRGGRAHPHAAVRAGSGIEDRHAQRRGSPAHPQDGCRRRQARLAGGARAGELGRRRVHRGSPQGP